MKTGLARVSEGGLMAAVPECFDAISCHGLDEQPALARRRAGLSDLARDVLVQAAQPRGRYTSLHRTLLRDFPLPVAALSSSEIRRGHHALKRAQLGLRQNAAMMRRLAGCA